MVMPRRIWVLSLGLLLGMGFLSEAVAAAEAAPPGDIPPLAMPKPKKKKKKKDDGKKAGPVIDACKSDFEAEPVPKEKRKIKPSENITRDSEQSITDAQASTNTEEKLRNLKAAQEALFDALKKDPYNAMATEHLASVYAIAGRRKCAKALLERLVILRDVKEFSQQAKRAIAAAKANTAFDAMRDVADRALQ